MKQRQIFRAALSCALFFCLWFLIFDITEPSFVPAIVWPERIPAYADLTLMPGADIADILMHQTNPTLVFNNLAGNVIMFGPVGFLLPLCWPWWRRFGRTVAFGAAASFCIEFCQIFNYRATVTDDLILNTLGAALGFLCFAVLAKLTGRLRPGQAGKWAPALTVLAAFGVYIGLSAHGYFQYVTM